MSDDDDDDSGITLLRPLFGRREDGKWAIEAMGKLKLRPTEKGQTDLFQIEDGMFLAQPKTIGTVYWALGQSIVPIVALKGDSPQRMRCIGTGFFVSCSGLLITAAHVIVDPMERGYGKPIERPGVGIEMPGIRLGIMLRTNPVFQTQGYFFRGFEWCEFLAEPTNNPLPIRGLDLRLSSDTAICKVQPMPDGSPYQPLGVIQPGIRGVGIAPGKSATAVGYGRMTEIIEINSGEDLEFWPHVSHGSVLERFPDNAVTRMASTPGACFSAAMKFPPGMSGSPIFDDERIYVHGVVSKGWQDENGVARHGYGSMLAPSLGLKLPLLGDRSLLDVLKSEDHGMPKIFIPDA